MTWVAGWRGEGVNMFEKVPALKNDPRLLAPTRIKSLGGFCVRVVRFNAVKKLPWSILSLATWWHSARRNCWNGLKYETRLRMRTVHFVIGAETQGQPGYR